MPHEAMLSLMFDLMKVARRLSLPEIDDGSFYSSLGAAAASFSLSSHFGYMMLKDVLVVMNFHPEIRFHTTLKEDRIYGLSGLC
jgi:hypothetical protein